jgi:hypothetical protein
MPTRILKCSFSKALAVLEATAEGKCVEGAWVSQFTGSYEFQD